MDQNEDKSLDPSGARDESLDETRDKKEQLNNQSNNQTNDQTNKQSDIKPDIQPDIQSDDQFENNIDETKPIQTAFGLVKARGIEQEMQESYLDYAMSVIVARALPDVRDGLKPVHRRVLYSMHELGLTSHAKYRKSATVVGDVLGKYHPHGDIAVYDSLVRMAQKFSMRNPLVDGQGNFGSLDGDSPAAMRYTEAKMTIIAEEMLADIEKNTVVFSPNFDGSREEPTVLPSKIPQLLLNGTLGIAVGMATNIPPHNLTELCEGIICLINNPEAEIDQLMQYIKAPDFPTGANIYNLNDIKEAYTTGKGRVLMRAVTNIEEKSSGGFRIVVSEIPYQVNKADLITKIADLVKMKKIEGITDLRDESDRKDGVRIVIELKSSAYPKKILNRLFELTPMQSVFHINMLALIDGIQPRVLTLKNVLEEFIKHRQNVVRRRTEFDLTRAKDRAHILEGLKKALDHIDAIIALIKKSETKEIAHTNLMKDFDLSDLQSTAILEMRLSALAGLERKKIDDELKEKLELIKKLQAILGSEPEILRIIKEELAEIKDKYGDERRTKIVAEELGSFRAEDLIPNEQMVVTLTENNYIKRVPVAFYRSQARGGKGVSGMTTKDLDTVGHLLVSMTHDDIMFFTDKGRLFKCKVYDLPVSSRIAKGQAIVNLLQLAPEEKVTAVITIDPKKQNAEKYLFMCTVKGVIKKTLIEAYKNVRKTGLIAIKLNAEDSLKWVVTTSENMGIVIVTRNGQSIHFNEQDARPMGRSAAGVRGIKLRVGDEVIAMNKIVSATEDVFTILENGFGKRTPIKYFTKQKRGGIGIRASKVTNKTGKVVEAMVVEGNEGDLVIMSLQGQIIRIPLKSVKRLGRDTQGVTLMRLNKDDKVASMTVFIKEEAIADVKNQPIKDSKVNKNDVQDNSQKHLIDKKELKEEKKKEKESAEIKVTSDGDNSKKKLKKLKTNDLNIKNQKKNQARSPEATARDAIGGIREGKMTVNIPQGKIINEIKPKKINTNKKPFQPYVKASKDESTKTFVPYVKASTQNFKTDAFKPYLKHSEKPTKIDTFQSADEIENKVKNILKKKKSSEPNYWGKV